MHLREWYLQLHNTPRLPAYEFNVCNCYTRRELEHIEELSTGKRMLFFIYLEIFLKKKER